jgi:hypothetical protein
MLDIDNGIVEMVVVENGEFVRYKAGICKDTAWDNLTFAYFDERGNVLVSPNGLLSAYIGNKAMKPERYQLITTNFDEMKTVVAEEKLRKEQMMAKKLEEARKKVERINQLPREFDSGIPSFSFIRTEAVYAPSRALAIVGGYIFLKTTLPQFSKTTLHPYVRSNGALLTKKFEHDFREIIPENMTARDVLRKLLEKQSELNDLVRNV